MQDKTNKKHLYTALDIEKERKRLYNLQNGIDPILGTAVHFKDTCCDHDHVLQNTRAALHRQTNSFEGRVVNAYKRGLSWCTEVPLPVILRNLADYLEQDYSENPLHSDWIKRCVIDFKSCNEKQKKVVLESLGSTDGKNATERLDSFKAVIKLRLHSFEEISLIIRKVKNESTN